MPPSTQANSNQDESILQQAIQQLTEKIDQLIASLPSTYITIRSHDKDMAVFAERLTALETWRNTSTQWAYNEHKAILKELGDGMTNMERRLMDKFDAIQLTQQQSQQQSHLESQQSQQRQMSILAQVLIMLGGTVFGSTLSLIVGIMLFHMHP